MKAEETFLTSSKNHQQATTKERQIDFMWHLYGQGFTQKEIAAVYNTTHHKVSTALQNKAKRQHA